MAVVCASLVFSAFFNGVVFAYGGYNSGSNHYSDSNVQSSDITPNGISRPCPNLDLPCIRKFFAQYSDCTPAAGPATDPYSIPRLELPIPNANLTFIWNNAQAMGLKEGNVNEFYVNTATNVLVIELVFNEISVYSPASIARYHLKGKEPVELSDYSFITYKQVSLTTTIPFDVSRGIQLPQAQVYAYIGDSRGYANVGSKLSSSEPELLRAYNQMLTNIATSMREAFIVQGPRHFSVYLDSNICSFRNLNKN